VPVQTLILLHSSHPLAPDGAAQQSAASDNLSCRKAGSSGGLRPHCRQGFPTRTDWPAQETRRNLRARPRHRASSIQTFCVSSGSDGGFRGWTRPKPGGSRSRSLRVGREGFGERERLCLYRLAQPQADGGLHLVRGDARGARPDDVHLINGEVVRLVCCFPAEAGWPARHLTTVFRTALNCYPSSSPDGQRVHFGAGLGLAGSVCFRRPGRQ